MLWRGVRLSSVQLHPSRVDIVSKRLLALSRKQRRMVAGRLKVSDAKDLDEYATGPHPSRTPNTRGLGKICDYRKTTRRISETVEDDAATVEMNRKLRVLCRRMTLPVTLNDPNHPKPPLVINFGRSSLSFEQVKLQSSNLIQLLIIASINLHG